MKKLFTLLLTLVMFTALFGCSKPEIDKPLDGDGTDVVIVPDNNNTDSIIIGGSSASLAPITITSEEGENGKTYTFSRMAVYADDLKQFDITDEYQAACAIIFALARYEIEPEDCFAMFDYMRGPEEISSYDKNFIKNQMDQYPYVVRSYFEGATVENNYEVSYVDSVSLTFRETPYSRTEDGYVQLYITSAGADSDRSVKLRQKGSTQEWFLFSDSYMGILSGIREPVEANPWN